MDNFWCLLVDTFVHEKSSFWVNFCGHFWVNSRGHVRAVCLLIETEGYHGSLYVKSNHAIELNTSDSLGDHWSL